MCGEIDVMIDVAIAGDHVLENQSKPHKTVKGIVLTLCVLENIKQKKEKSKGKEILRGQHQSVVWI